MDLNVVAWECPLTLLFVRMNVMINLWTKENNQKMKVKTTDSDLNKKPNNKQNGNILNIIIMGRGRNYQGPCIGSKRQMVALWRANGYGNSISMFLQQSLGLLI